MDHSIYDCDVVIVGFGPTGVSAALSLGQLGISAIAVEREEEIYPRARAVTVNDWTMRCFQSVGLDAELKRDMDVPTTVRYRTYDGQDLLRTVMPPSALGHATSYSIYQPLMEQSLRDSVHRFPEIDVRFGVEVTGVEQDEDGVTVAARDLRTATSSNFRAHYVLACDGGSSATRRSVDVHMDGDTLDVRWIVIDAKAKRWWPNRHILTMWSDAKRPVVDIALARGNHRWEIPLTPEERDEDFATEAQVWPLLENLGVSRDDVDYHQHAFYSHHLRMAQRWRVGRVFLLGDAAHLMPPWAGSGMQSGIRDAFNLAWKLHEVLAGRMADNVLDTYEAERRPNVEFLTNLSRILGKIVKQEELTAQEAAAVAPDPDAVEQVNPVSVSPSYPAGWFRGPATEDSPVGTMIPQPQAANPRGLIGPLDDLLGPGFVLLGDGVDPTELLTPEEKRAWDGLGARYVAVRSPDQWTSGPDDIVDIDGTLLAWLRRFEVRAVAVRPDRFVAAADPTGLAVP